MKDIYILGIETSCDETSVSIVKNGEEEISTVVLSQIDIHKKFGGVVSFAWKLFPCQIV